MDTIEGPKDSTLKLKATEKHSQANNSKNQKEEDERTMNANNLEVLMIDDEEIERVVTELLEQIVTCLSDDEPMNGMNDHDDEEFEMVESDHQVADYDAGDSLQLNDQQFDLMVKNYKFMQPFNLAEDLGHHIRDVLTYSIYFSVPRNQANISLRFFLGNSFRSVNIRYTIRSSTPEVPDLYNCEAIVSLPVMLIQRIKDENVLFYFYEQEMPNGDILYDQKIEEHKMRAIKLTQFGPSQGTNLRLDGLIVFSNSKIDRRIKENYFHCMASLSVNLHGRSLKSFIHFMDMFYASARSLGMKKRFDKEHPSIFDYLLNKQELKSLDTILSTAIVALVQLDKYEIKDKGDMIFKVVPVLDQLTQQRFNTIARRLGSDNVNHLMATVNEASKQSWPPRIGLCFPLLAYFTLSYTHNSHDDQDLSSLIQIINSDVYTSSRHISDMKQTCSILEKLHEFEPNNLLIAMHFFGFKCKENMTTMIANFKPDQSIKYLSTLVLCESRRNGLVLNDSIRKVFLMVLDHLSLVVNRTSKRYNTASSHCLIGLLSRVINEIPKEYNLIYRIVKLNLDSSYIESRLNFDYWLKSEFSQVIKPWIYFQFSPTTLLQNFGLEKNHKQTPNQGVFLEDLLTIKMNEEGTQKYKEAVLHLFRAFLIESADLRAICQILTEYKFDALKLSGQIIRSCIEQTVDTHYMIKHPVASINVLNECMARKNSKLLYSFTAKYAKYVNSLNQAEFSSELLELLRHHLGFLSKKQASFLDNSTYETNISVLVKSLLANAFSVIDSSAPIRTIKAFEKHSKNACAILELIASNSKFFNELTTADKGKLSSISHMKPLIEMRVREVQMFRTYKESLTPFLQICSKLNGVNLRLYQDKLEWISATGFDKIPLDIVCSPVLVDSLRNGTPNVTYFDHITPSRFQKIAETVELDRLKCVIFDYYLEESFKEYKAKNVQLVQVVDLIQILDHILPEAFEKWHRLATSIETQSLKLVEINMLVKNLFSNNYKRFQSEIFYIIGSKYKIRNLDTRKYQISLYEKYRSSSEAAHWLNKIHGSLEMTKRFVELHELLNMNTEEFDQWTLAKMNPELENTIKILDRISMPERVACLQAYADSLPLVKWLRGNVRNLNEFKFLVDLASLAQTSEHSQNNVIFAKTLKEAGIAFSPLIFELNVDIGFKPFAALCDIVWTNLDNDKSIAQKLIAVKDSVELLEKIKNKKGNVELSAINQAIQLNESGNYKVGFFHHNQDHQTGFVQDLSPTQLIEMDIELKYDSIVETGGNENASRIQKKTNTKKKRYSFEELNELKSILMLVARTGEEANMSTDNAGAMTEAEHLEYFIDVFDSILLLSDMIVRLINSGCWFYEDIRIKFSCDIQNTLSKKQPVEIQLGGRFVEFNDLINQSHGVSSVDQLKKLCQFMESSLISWQKHVETIRCHYNTINLFTINQIVLLKMYYDHLIHQKNSTNQLVTLEQIQNLLFPLNQNLQVSYLAELHASSMIEFKHQKQSKEENEFCEHYCKEQNFPLLVVKNAVAKFGMSDLDALYEYCYEKSEMPDEEMDTEQIRQSDDLVDMDSNDSEVNNLLKKEKHLVNKFRLVFEKFLKEESGLSSKHVTLEHLAYILEMMGRSQSKSWLPRRVPGFLTFKGKPNLIVCTTKQQVEIVLTIYANSPNNPLPANDEVLFCHSKTTSEEVENFLRIAYKSNGDKIYTLMNIQDIDYENTSRIERFLTSNHTAEQTDNYVVVFICCNDKQEKTQQPSILSSLLVKNKVTALSLSTSDLEKYLLNKLVTSQSDSLAVYDLNKSSCRALLSKQAGNGKSTFVDKFKNSIPEEFDFKLIRIKSNCINLDDETQKLIEYVSLKDKKKKKTLYHIDIANEVFQNINLYLFNLVVLGYIKHSNGLVYRRSSQDLFLIEMMSPCYPSSGGKSTNWFHSILNFIPRIEFRSPTKYLYDLKNSNELEHNQNLLVDNLFNFYYQEARFQRSAYYLRLFKEDMNSLGSFLFSKATQLDQIKCLDQLLSYVELNNPSWAELANFVNFLDEQIDCIESCDSLKKIIDLKTICARFVIMMAYDFGSPSLRIGSDATLFNIRGENELEIDISKLELARKWENSAHPYILFYERKQAFTLMGIYLDRRLYKFVNPNSNAIMADNEINIPSHLRIELLRKEVPIFDNFNDFPRTRKISLLRKVMGLDSHELNYLDPDPTYELTVDNCLKLMAIFMRLRTRSPVIIMGETGCGKTRKIKFYSSLHYDAKDKKNADYKHLIHFKIHGGVTYQDIQDKVAEAERLSRENFRKLYRNNSTIRSAVETNGVPDIPATAILFFDEANTTEAIGLIKEILCDQTCQGRQINFSYGLKIIAAINPYRRHTDEMITKLEEAGLGFFMSPNESKEKFGHLPMRHLVYRVQPLPASLLPLIWDFGQLDENTENIYICQMLSKSVKSLLNISDVEIKFYSRLLTKCQEFMREQRDECSFVSLRDIERVIKITSWFISKKEIILNRMVNKSNKVALVDQNYADNIDDIKRSFNLALAVCYHSSLQSQDRRFKFRKLIGSYLLPDKPYSVQNDWVLNEILLCQHIFLDEVHLASNIARNSALLENVFMIIICLELRIPLFIVGKPGSSKSLAKSIVSNAMHGNNSKSELFKNLKETYFVNFQCSPLTKPEMIIEAFRSAASFQENYSLDKYVSVVNLDEIGLAEGSESMPLKTLHPLLEEGVETADNKVKESNKVGFIGISNWALDPAKMNRGIFVSRGEPDISELIESAKGICNYNDHIYKSINPFIKEIAEAYLDLCEQAKRHRREFFGLRDFYSLIKMLYWFCSRDAILTWSKLEHSVRRNFGGLDLECVEPFKRRLYSKLDTRQLDTDPKCSPIDLIYSALKGESVESNARYLLLLTENYSLLDMIQSYLTQMLQIPSHKLSIIFGSSFRNDLQYTEVCRNISRIKASMEMGNTVILLNLQNLYESLYDTLNQYYYEFAGQRYVYLGLNTHRVECAVHKDFRLIIVSDKETVYDLKRFPIPLINRLEKHFLTSAIMLNPTQTRIAAQVANWVNAYCKSGIDAFRAKPKPSDIFIGYHEDTVPSILLYLAKGNAGTLEQMDDDTEYDEETLETKVKSFLLRCATADSIVRLTLNQNKSPAITENVWDEYFINQNHSSLSDLIKGHLSEYSDKNDMSKNLLQITTHSKMLLSKLSLTQLANRLNIRDEENNFATCILQSFETQQQFSAKIKSFLNGPTFTEEMSQDYDRFMIVQCDFSKKYDGDLLSCARYTIVEQIKQYAQSHPGAPLNANIVLLVILAKENSKKFIGFQISEWACYHLDDIDELAHYLPHLSSMKSTSLSSILKSALEASVAETCHKNTLELKTFFKKIAHQSCSLICDTNMSRTIDRIEIFMRLCEDKDFLSTIAKRLLEIQIEKEASNQRVANNWLSKEVADLKNINEYSTLKRSCENYIESKLSTLLGFILSKLDYLSNMNIYLEPVEWKKHLFLDILGKNDFFSLQYEDMRDPVKNEELKQFVCNSDRFAKDLFASYDQNLKPCLPFFWILVNKLNEFSFSYKDSVQTDSTEKFLKTIPDLFENSPIYQVFATVAENYQLNEQQLLDSYINDFILINCPKVSTEKELNTIKSIIKLMISKVKISKNQIKFHLPLVHFFYEKISQRVDMYLKFSALNPKINNDGKIQLDENSFDLDACLTAVALYVHPNIQEQDMLDMKSKLDALLKLIREMLTLYANNYNDTKMAQLVDKYHSLEFIALFFDYVILSKRASYESSEFVDVFKTLVAFLKVEFNRTGTPGSKSHYVEFLHKFIIKCISGVKKTLFDYMKKSKCCGQEKPVYHKIFPFICECIVCSDCEKRMRLAMVNNQTVCAVCKKQINTNGADLSIQLEKISQKKRAFETFLFNLNKFYINVVEMLILTTEKNGVDGKLVELFIKAFASGHVEDGLELRMPIEQANRRLLFKLLYKRYPDQVLKQLNPYFTSNQLNDHVLQVAVSVISCFEDTFVCQLTPSLEQHSSLAIMMSEDLLANLHLLIEAFDPKSARFTSNILLSLAKVKFCIKVAANLMHDQGSIDSIHPNLINKLNENLKAIITHVKEQRDCNILFNYLIKEFVRKHAFSSIKFVTSQPSLNWMVPREIIGEDLSLTDRYVLLGPKYIDTRSAITKSITDRSSKPLEELITKNDPNSSYPYLLVALYMNITTLYKDMDQAPVESIRPVLESRYKHNYWEWKSILENNLTHHMQISKENWKHVELCMLLMQIDKFVKYSKSSMVQTLARLINSPSQFAHSYLPCMPQDNMFDVQRAVRTASRGHDNPTFYECPNGHPYVLFNCGQPWVEYTCDTCGAKIGGTNHNLLSGNKRMNIEDQTKTGYCLSYARNSADNPITDRSLSSQNYHVLRFLIHACLYLASDKETEVHQLMTVVLNANDKKEFFWDHMQKDLRIASKCMNLNTDELIILLHYIVDNMKNSNFSCSSDRSWLTKEDRLNWETKFAENFLQPVLSKIPDYLSKANKSLSDNQTKKEEDNQSKKLYFMAYELNLDANEKRLYCTHQIWKYTPMVDLNLFLNELNITPKDQFVLLKKFIELRSHLALLPNLADMMKFVNYLRACHLKRIFRHQASQTTIIKSLASSAFVSEWSNQKNLESVLDKFQTVWINTKSHLAEYISKNISKNCSLVQTMDFEFNISTPLSVFLPTVNGDGLVTYAMIHCLCRLHNELIEFYYKSNRLQSEAIDAKLMENKFYNIWFEHDNDLLRIAQCNATYDSTTCKCRLDIDNITDQIVDKYLNNKQPVDLKTIATFEYSDEIIDDSLFKKLRHTIRQETLDVAVQTTIFNEFSTISSIAEAVNILRIMINYIKTIQPHSSKNLGQFMQMIFIESNESSGSDQHAAHTAQLLLGPTVASNCLIRHIESLWHLLMMKKAFLYTINGLPVFENLHQNFKESSTVDLLTVTPSPTLTLSLALVLYQLIEYHSKEVYDNESHPTWKMKINDFFYDLDSLNILVPIDPSKLVGIIAADVQMKSLHSVWLRLCDLIRKFD